MSATSVVLTLALCHVLALASFAFWLGLKVGWPSRLVVGWLALTASFLLVGWPSRLVVSWLAFTASSYFAGLHGQLLVGWPSRLVVSWLAN